VYGYPAAADAVNPSAEGLPSPLVTRLSNGGAGAGDTGGAWFDFLIAAAECRAV